MQRRSSKGTTMTARETWRARCEDGCFIKTQTLTADLTTQVLGHTRKIHVCGSAECAQVWCGAYKDSSPSRFLVLPGGTQSRFMDGSLSSGRITRVSKRFRCARLVFRISFILSPIQWLVLGSCVREFHLVLGVPLRTPALHAAARCQQILRSYRAQKNAEDASLTSPTPENLELSLQPTFVRRGFLLFSRAPSSVQS